MTCRLNGKEQTATFIHIPKTGGHVVEGMARLIDGGTHNPVGEKGCEQRHLLPVQLRTTPDYMFTVVRHPLAWYASWWKYNMALMKRRGWTRWRAWGDGGWHPCQPLDACRPNNGEFDLFIRNVVSRAPGFLSHLAQHYIGPPGWQIVDLVGTQETLLDDLATVAKTIGADVSKEDLVGIGWPNKTLWDEPEWTLDLKEAVLETEAVYVERFYGDTPPQSRKRGHYR